MRYALFSDIHGNLEAYEAAEEALAKENVEKKICIGDIVGYGANPDVCIEKTRKLTPFVVCGNHDWASAGLCDTTYFNQYAKEAALWTSRVLSEEHKKYLKDLKLLHKEDGFMTVHGSLNRPEEFEYISDTYTAQITFRIMDFQICFVGHSHVAGIFYETNSGRVGYTPGPKIKVEKTKKYIVNVGSVGQPRDFDPRAGYCIYDDEKGTIEIKRVGYDIKKKPMIR